MTEQEKMISGMIYDASDDDLATMRKYAHKMCNRYNKLDEDDEKRAEILDSLVPEHNGAYLQGPIFFDAPVTIGDNVFFGPNVTIATPVHPLLPAERNMYINERGILTDREYARPIVIESDCWIASNVVICGGVTIGKGSVIGAGSVVTRDIPAGCFAAGNPCKVIRKLTDNDSIYNKKDLWEKQ